MPSFSDRVLAWRAFLGAGRLKDAYELALSTIAVDPSNKVWQVRLAKIALQTSHPNVALSMYYHLVLENKLQFLGRAIALASTLEEDSRLVRLLEVRLSQAPQSKRTWIDAIGVLRSENEASKAARLLRRAIDRHPSKFLLWELVVLYHSMGQPQQEEKTLRRFQKMYGSVPKVALQMATVLYVKGHVQAAYKELRRGRTLAASTNTDYWRTLASLAWLTEHYKAAEEAEEKLYTHHNANAADLTRLFLLVNKPHLKWAIGRFGWHRYHKRQFFLDMLSVSSNASGNSLLKKTFSLLSIKYLHVVSKSQFFWSSLASYDIALNRPQKAIAAYREALSINPNNGKLLAGYIWLLVDANARSRLRSEITELDALGSRHPSTWSALAAAHELLGQHRKSLMYLNAAFPRHRNSPTWLLGYADELSNDGNRAAARAVRVQSLVMLSAGKQQHSKCLQGCQSGWIRLYKHLKPGTDTLEIFGHMTRYLRSAEVRRTILTWALNSGNIALARLWYHSAFDRTRPAAWLQLAYDLKEHDVAKLKQLLNLHSSLLSYSGRAAAANQIGWTDYAMTMDWDELQTAAEQQSTASDYVADAISKADWGQSQFGWLHASGLDSYDASGATAIWLRPKLRLLVRYEHDRQLVYNHHELGLIPPAANIVSVDVRRMSVLGFLGLQLRYMQTGTRYVGISANWSRRWTKRLSTILKIDYRRRPHASIPLYLSAQGSWVAINASFLASKANDISAAAMVGNYHADQGGYLGSFERINVGFTHRLTDTRPHLNWSSTITAAHFSDAKHLPSQLRPLIPPDQPTQTSFFIPSSYTQICSGLNAQPRLTKGFALQLSVMAQADLCYNSVLGKGYVLGAGLMMPILGPDRLSLLASIDQGNHGISGRSETIQLSYRYYFSP